MNVLLVNMIRSKLLHLLCVVRTKTFSPLFSLIRKLQSRSKKAVIWPRCSLERSLPRGKQVFSIRACSYRLWNCIYWISYINIIEKFVWCNLRVSWSIVCTPVSSKTNTVPFKATWMSGRQLIGCAFVGTG